MRSNATAPEVKNGAGSGGQRCLAFVKKADALGAALGQERSFSKGRYRAARVHQQRDRHIYCAASQAPKRVRG